MPEQKQEVTKVVTFVKMAEFLHVYQVTLKNSFKAYCLSFDGFDDTNYYLYKAHIYTCTDNLKAPD